MFTRFIRQRSVALGLTCLLFVILVLAACGGAAESVSEESAAPGEAEEVSQPAAEEEQVQESQEATSSSEAETTAAEEESETTAEEESAAESEATSEEPVAEESEATENENLLAPSQELASSDSAECRTVTPDNDPIAAVLQPNELIAAISDDDWSKGPADAPITVIEYGDFQ